MKTTEFLKNHSLQELIDEHGVYASFSKCGRFFSLNYDQIKVKEDDPLAQECRGLILSKPDGSSLNPQAITINNKLSYNHLTIGETKINAFPMKRFFNHGQSAAFVNWNDPNLSILEKLDGSLIIVWFNQFDKVWEVATRSVPQADIPMDNSYTFRALFEKAVQETMKMPFSTFSKCLIPDYTYCFELTSPYNQIVVQYPTCKMTLLACRNLQTLKEIDPKSLSIVQIGNVPYVQEYKYSSLNELINWVNARNGMEYEGVIVRDSNFNRIKIKNPEYTAYNKIKENISSARNKLEVLLREKEDDIIAFLPEEIVKDLLEMKEKLQKVIKLHDEFYHQIKNQATDKKSFALLATKSKFWTAPLFQIFDGKAQDTKDFILKNQKDSWSNSFLDKILDCIKNISEDL